MAAVADDFWKIYTNEWLEASKSLRSEKHDDSQSLRSENHERHDEEIIYLLMQIVRGVYEFCLDETKTSHHKKKTEEMTEAYLHHRLPSSFHRDHVPNPVKSFIHRCIGCLYDMCLMKHSPLYIYWIPKGDIIDKQKFDIEDDKGEQVCDWTKWPAVMKTDGTVLKKGVVIPVR